MANEPTPSAVPFREAIRFLRRRLGITTADWYALVNGADYAAAAMAQGQKESMLNDILAAVLEAIEDGGTYEDFREDYARIVAEHGWSYHGDPGWHSRLIFRTQTATAYAAGRWEQIQRQVEARPNTRFYLRYVTVEDERVRETHAGMHGVILPVGHGYWLTHYPPNGFNCRCRVQLITERDLGRYGGSVTPDDDPRLTIPPDPGWSGNAGIAGLLLRDGANRQFELAG